MLTLERRFAMMDYIEKLYETLKLPVLHPTEFDFFDYAGKHDINAYIIWDHLKGCFSDKIYEEKYVLLGKIKGRHLPMYPDEQGIGLLIEEKATGNRYWFHWSIPEYLYRGLPKKMQDEIEAEAKEFWEEYWDK